MDEGYTRWGQREPGPKDHAAARSRPNQRHRSATNTPEHRLLCHISACPTAQPQGKLCPLRPEVCGESGMPRVEFGEPHSQVASFSQQKGQA